MTGTFIPWWAWLLLAQAGFTYALFEYVRGMRNSASSSATLDKVEATPISAGLAERLGNAEARILHLHRLSPPLNGLEARLERLERHASDVERQERHDFASKVSTMVAAARMSRPKPEDRDTGPQIDRAKQRSQIVYQICGVMTNRGIQEIVGASLQDAEKAVIADAKKFVFEGNDAEVWRSQDEKRQWHVNEAKLDALRDKIKEIESVEWNRR